jgi:uncharacterized protein
MKHILGLWLLTHVLLIGQAQQHSEENVVLMTPTGEITGTLTTASAKKHPVALIIAGSGPTDRNGNNPSMKNNALQQLAMALAEKGISSIRYDKRGVAESKAAAMDEFSLTFEDYVADARAWINLLKQKKEFTSVTVIGHSEGSLIGMIAGQGLADQFISIAGPGRPADQILKEQLQAQPQMIKDLCYPIIDSLKAGKKVENINPMLNALFRPSVQPYLISWFKYNPQTELKKLNIPSLILQGTNDLQVKTEDAELLSKSAPNTTLAIVRNMNHVLKMIEPGDKKHNLESYNNPDLPISAEMMDWIKSFIPPS